MLHLPPRSPVAPACPASEYSLCLYRFVAGQAARSGRFDHSVRSGRRRFGQPPQRIPLTAILQVSLLPSTSATSPSFPASCLPLQVVARVRRLEIHRLFSPSSPICHS